MIRRSTISTITEAGMFFEKTGPVWRSLHVLDERLEVLDVPYVVIGGLALNAFHYPRQTIDIDVVVTADGLKKFRDAHLDRDYRQAGTLGRRVIDASSDVAIDFLIAGELAGNASKNTSIRFPEPSEAEIHGDIKTIPLARLVELKLVTWRYKDWGDVVELIRRNRLTQEFGETLHPLVRAAYGECWDQAHDPGYDVE